MKRLAFLPLVVIAFGCASERDPYAITPEEGKAAAAKTRPKLPPGSLPLNGDQPTRMALPPPKGGRIPPGGNDNLQIPPGAVPTRSGDAPIKGK